MSSESITVRSPASREKIVDLPIATSAEVAAAVARGREAQSAWQETSFAQRAAIMYRFRDMLIDEQEKLADILTSESGKPRDEVYGNELFYVCDVIGFWARNAEKFLRAQNIQPHLLMFRSKKGLFDLSSARRHRHHQPVEFSPRAHRRRCRTRAYGRQCGRHQTLGADAADRPLRCRARRQSRATAKYLANCHWHRQRPAKP